MTDQLAMLEVERERGQQARDLLNNPLFPEIWTHLEAQLVQALKSANLKDADALQKGVMMLQILERTKTWVEDAATTGKMATIQLAEKSKWERIKAVAGMNG